MRSCSRWGVFLIRQVEGGIDPLHNKESFSSCGSKLRENTPASYTQLYFCRYLLIASFWCSPFFQIIPHNSESDDVESQRVRFNNEGVSRFIDKGYRRDEEQEGSCTMIKRGNMQIEESHSGTRSSSSVSAAQIGSIRLSLLFVDTLRYYTKEICKGKYNNRLMSKFSFSFWIAGNISLILKSFHGLAWVASWEICGNKVRKFLRKWFHWTSL